ncbi:MAG: competence/damage-inducible protein A [Nitrospira sp.]|nr:competence/damage-inducible protein A [Nitrospira sp.]
MGKSVSAGIIIIGNEILSGKVKDDNSYYLACELRKLGVDVRKISIIPDEIELIGSEVSEFSSQYNYVFTSGGVGPTHDDVTMAGIAMGFGVKLVESDEIREMLHSRFRYEVNNAVMKMALVPEGSTIEFREDLRFPVVSYRNIYIFPGIPEFLRNKFQFIKEKFRGEAFFLKRLYLNSHESLIADILSSIVRDNLSVMFGSYPIMDNPDYRIIITAESKTEEDLKNAVAQLITELPEGILVKAE